MGRALVLVVSMGWLLACASGGQVEEGGAEPAPADREVPDPPEEKAPARSKAGKQGTLRGLQQGDIACYVELEIQGGETLSLHGDFELCPGGGSDASALVGQRVRYRTETSKVQADSCEGDPDCPDTEDVELVVALKAAK